ncbi:MAG: bifunctional riboflavin kinase/FMN adenylyltransferase [Acidobacteria bacterium]|nr:bifunctional riboflavin kinase/FMN adenylyltransferase [Acidobacteriota bacterium]MBI3664181.1 bifunctional riboflavin kinase/FMN adenylyltransferase [Acidobacteriota bacterium]
MPMQLCVSLQGWTEQFGPEGSGRRSTVVTIGNFDGLHLGHQKIINRLIERARALGAIATVVSFEPHPLKVLRPNAAPPLIGPLEHRLVGLDQMGLDAALVLPFDLELSRLSAEDFVRQILVEKLRARAVLVGGNFRFGHQQAGDVKLLIELGAKLGFDVEVIAPVVMRGEIVSSTCIRDAVRAGLTTRAARRLGHPFCLTGAVQPGTGTGKRLVVPTLNLAPDQELLPKMGVYATETWIALSPGEGTAIGLPRHPPDRPSRVYRSVTNIGVRPTFQGTCVSGIPNGPAGRVSGVPVAQPLLAAPDSSAGKLSVESHLLDFSAELHTGWLAIEFWVRLRDEMKFPGPDELRAQIDRDIASARKFFRRLDRARNSMRTRPHHPPDPF